MALSPGTRLGPYEIVAQLGAGGMGEVYRARDTKLERDVAIKVLPQAVAENPERLARFEREAKVLAALNHPNIAQIYGLEQGALVMELVEGETLSGPLPLQTALTYARQIAAGLEAAHEKGIVHRDLKPANLKVTPAGVVKILDFGLASVVPDAPSGTDPADSPTLTMRQTQLGVILGTAAYMSPEQARGKPVDQRADIWAFGVVLYEMIAGQPLFQGETVSDILAAVLAKEPDLSQMPGHVSYVAERCLRKDPRRRWQAVHDVAMSLDEPPVLPLPEIAAQPTRRRWLWVGTGTALSAALAGSAAWFLKPDPDQPLVHLDIAPPEGFRLPRPGPGQLALSPDGHWLVFSASGPDGKRSLWLRNLETSAIAGLPGTENGVRPFWSPDSRWVGFFSDGRLFKVALAGGEPQLICNGESTAATWNSEGTIIFHETGKPIQRVSAFGGTPVPVLSFDTARGETGQIDPYFLPDGIRFLYLSNATEPGIVLASLDGRARRFLFPQSSSSATYVPSPAGGGWILYVSGGRLFGRPFDPDRATVRDPIALADSLVNGPVWSASRGGLLAFRRVRGDQTKLAWHGRDGKLLAGLGEPGTLTAPRVSPDQQRILFTRTDQGNADIWLLDITRNTSTRLTFETGNDSNSVWLPGSDRFIYSSSRKNDRLLVERAATGAGAEKIVQKSQVSLQPTGITPDGQWLVVTEPQSSGAFGPGTHILLFSLANGKIVSLLGGTNVQGGSISPDGRWLLYSAVPAGRREIFVQSLPAEVAGSSENSKWQISVSGGKQPVWRADGREIFYLALDGVMMAVPLDVGAGAFRPGVPKPLFQTRLIDDGPREFDVASDGRRFLLNQPSTDSPDSPITLIVNWPKLLQKI